MKLHNKQEGLLFLHDNTVQLCPECKLSADVSPCKLFYFVKGYLRVFSLCELFMKTIRAPANVSVFFGLQDCFQSLLFLLSVHSVLRDVPSSPCAQTQRGMRGLSRHGAGAGAEPGRVNRPMCSSGGGVELSKRGPCRIKRELFLFDGPYERPRGSDPDRAAGWDDPQV